MHEFIQNEAEKPLYAFISIPSQEQTEVEIFQILWAHLIDANNKPAFL